jgi:hypothetical protein
MAVASPLGMGRNVEQPDTQRIVTEHSFSDEAGAVGRRLLEIVV